MVLIQPGEYYDCAVWQANRLTVAGAGPGVVVTDAVCQGKAVFVVTGDGVAVRDLTLARARTEDGNAAGIRAEGRTLVVERVQFRGNEVGILSGAAGPGRIDVKDCRFEGNGSSLNVRLPAVLVGGLDLLQVTGSTFRANRGGQVGSSAGLTALRDNVFEQDGPGPPDASPAAALAVAVAVDGALLAEGNTFRFPAAAGTTVAMRAMGSEAPVLRRNRLEDGGNGATLLVDWTSADPVLDGNEVAAGAELVTTRGLWRHRASGLYHGAVDTARGAAGRVKRAVLKVLGR